MTTEINIKCCEGNEEYPGQCLKNRCPLYAKANDKVQMSWPRMPTGFGNAYGDPKHSDYLRQVRDDVKNKAKKVE